MHLLWWFWASPVTLALNHTPANERDRKTWVQSLDWEDALEKGTATHAIILAWRIPWTDEPVRLQGVSKSQTRLKRLSTRAWWFENHCIPLCCNF